MPEIRKDISGIFASGMQTARAEEMTIRSSLLAPDAVADVPHLAVAFRRAALSPQNTEVSVSPCCATSVGHHHHCSAVASAGILNVGDGAH